MMMVLQAINNYSLTVAQNEARRAQQLSPASRLGSDGKPVSIGTSSTSSEHSVSSRIFVYEGLLGMYESISYDLHLPKISMLYNIHVYELYTIPRYYVTNKGCFHLIMHSVMKM